MRELVEETGAYHFCGEPTPNRDADAAAYVVCQSGACVAGRAGRGLLSVTRERSGLAYAAGFAGVLYLFRYSFAPFASAQLGPGWPLTTVLIFVWSLLAPAALVLAFAAGVSLDRSPEKSGALPALFGLFVGWFGTVSWLFLLNGLWLKVFDAF
jgi:hypothetical protein